MLMYEFHHDYMQSKYGSKLSYKDTDSFVCDIKRHKIFTEALQKICRDKICYKRIFNGQITGHYQSEKIKTLWA